MQPHRDRMPPVDYELPADYEAARIGVPPEASADRGLLFLAGLVLGAGVAGTVFIIFFGQFRPPF